MHKIADIIKESKEMLYWLSCMSEKFKQIWCEVFTYPLCVCGSAVVPRLALRVESVCVVTRMDPTIKKNLVV